MKKFNEFMEAVLIAKVVPTSDAVAPVETCDACGNTPQKDMFSNATDDFMKELGFEDNVEGQENIIQPDDNVGETGEIESDEETSTSNIELECLGEEGLQIKFNGLTFVLPKDVVEAIKGYETDESAPHEESETEEQHEQHEESETPEEEAAEHSEGETESNEDEEAEEEKKEVTESVKKGKAVNPWAVCNKSTGGKKKAGKEKFERCVTGVKSEHKIKK
jgi:hypothetical protein